MPTVTIRVRTLVGSLLIAALVGMGARGLWAGPTGPVQRAVAAVAAKTPGPRAEMHGVPVGFAHTRLGAATAAATYVRQGQRVFDLPTDQRSAALRTLASPAAADSYLAAQTQQLTELDGIQSRGHGRLIWDVSVLASRVDAYTPQRARISIWRVGVLSIDGLHAPLAEWTIVVYELLWEHSDWRIWSESQTPGPTPMGHPEQAPSTPEQLRGALAGFERYPGADPL